MSLHRFLKLNGLRKIIAVQATLALSTSFYPCLAIEKPKPGSPSTNDELKKITQSLKRKPNDISLLNRRAVALIGLSRYADAEQNCREILSTSPKNIEALNNLAWALNEQGRHDQAINVCNSALAIAPNNASFYFSRGCAYYAKGDCAKAVKDFDKCIEIHRKIFWKTRRDI